MRKVTDNMVIVALVAKHALLKTIVRDAVVVGAAVAVSAVVVEKTKDIAKDLLGMKRGR